MKPFNEQNVPRGRNKHGTGGWGLGGWGVLLFNINENIPCEIVNNEDIPNGIEMILF